MVKYLVEPEPSPTAALGEITWGVIMTSTRLWAPWERGAPGPLQVVWDGARMDGEPGLGDRTRGDGDPQAGAGVQLLQVLGCREGPSLGCRAGLEPAGSRAGASREAAHQEMRDHELLQIHSITKSTPQPSLTIHSSVYSLTNTGSFLIQTLTNPVLKDNRFCSNAGVPGKATVSCGEHAIYTNLQVAWKKYN